MSYFPGLGKRGGFKPLTLEDLDSTPGMHHLERAKRTKTQESASDKVEAAVNKVKRTFVKECTSCHKKYSVTFKNPESAKADYICRKCLVPK